MRAIESRLKVHILSLALIARGAAERSRVARDSVCANEPLWIRASVWSWNHIILKSLFLFWWRPHPLALAYHAKLKLLSVRV
jgi:hypothetical protein